MEDEVEADPEAKFGLVLTQFQTVADFILSSFHQGVVDCAVHDKRFVQSMDLFVDLYLQNEIVYADHVQTMLNVTMCIKSVRKLNPSLRHLLSRHQQTLKEFAPQSSLMILDESTGRLRTNVDATCEDTLSYAKYVKSLPPSKREPNIKLLIARFQSTLEFCQLSKRTAKTRLATMTQILSIIMDITTVEQVALFTGFADRVKAAFKACPRFHIMNERSEWYTVPLCLFTIADLLIGVGAMMDLAVYTAILKSFDAQNLATHSNDVLRVDLELVQAQVQQLTKAMARMHEMQETVRQLAQGKPVYSTSASFESLLMSTQDMQQQLVATMSKLASPKKDKSKKDKRKREEKDAGKASKSQSKGEAQEIAQLEAEMQSFYDTCTALKTKEDKAPDNETTVGTMLICFQTVASLILSSSYQGVVDCAAENKRFVQAMNILMELLVQYKRVQLHHVPSMISLTDALANLISKNSSLEKLLIRHQQAVLDYVTRTSTLLTVDQSTGKLSRNIDAMCEDSLSFAKYMKSLSTGLRKSKAKLLTARLLSILEHCPFSEQTAREASSQNRMKKLTQIFTVIVDIITLFRDPKKQAARFEEFTTAVKAAFKACPTFHSMNEAEEQRLDSYFSSEFKENDEDKTLEEPTKKSPAKKSKTAPKEPQVMSKLTRRVREGLDVSLAEIDAWERNIFSLKQFDHIMTILTDVMGYSCEEWDPRADPKVKECIEKMLKNVVGINKIEHRQKWQKTLEGWERKLLH